MLTQEKYQKIIHFTEKSNKTLKNILFTLKNHLFLIHTQRKIKFISKKTDKNIKRTKITRV